jgi:hypothetical protein
LLPEIAHAVHVRSQKRYSYLDGIAIQPSGLATRPGGRHRGARRPSTIWPGGQNLCSSGAGHAALALPCPAMSADSDVKHLSAMNPAHPTPIALVFVAYWQLVDTRDISTAKHPIAMRMESSEAQIEKST